MAIKIINTQFRSGGLSIDQLDLPQLVISVQMITPTGKQPDLSLRVFLFKDDEMTQKVSLNVDGIQNEIIDVTDKITELGGVLPFSVQDAHTLLKAKLEENPNFAGNISIFDPFAL